jgi:hypothetical protein
MGGVLFTSRDAWRAGTRDSGLAGHRSLNTTLRYMHLSPAAIEGAIRLLEPAQAFQTFGDGDRRNPQLIDLEAVNWGE